VSHANSTDINMSKCLDKVFLLMYTSMSYYIFINDVTMTTMSTIQRVLIFNKGQGK